MNVPYWRALSADAPLRFLTLVGARYAPLLGVAFVLAACSSPFGSTSPKNGSLEEAGYTTPLPDNSPLPQTGEPVGEGYMGAYIPGGAWQPQKIAELEAAVGRELDIVQWFNSWRYDFEARPVEDALLAGRTPLITWQPNTQSLADIANGKHDDYLRTWAVGIREVGRDAAARGLADEVYLRPFPEMNGDWIPWNGDPEGLIAAWRHMVELFAAEGAGNVRWVWSPNITDWPRVEENKLERYYPGGDYVDIIGLDGYNWGDTQVWSTWQSFEAIYTVPYKRVSALGSEPIWLTEIASAESGGNKALWIKEMLDNRAFPRVEAVVWFHERKEADWRANSSKRAAKAFRDWFVNQ